MTSVGLSHTYTHVTAHVYPNENGDFKKLLFIYINTQKVRYITRDMGNNCLK